MPLLIGQVWPQFQFVKILWQMQQSNVLWKYEKEKLQKEIGCLGTKIQQTMIGATKI